MSYTNHLESGELDYPSNINFHNNNGSNKDFVPTNQTPGSNQQSENNNRDQFKQIDAQLKPSEEGSSTNIPQVNNAGGNNNSNLMNNLNQQYNMSNNSQGIFLIGIIFFK